MLLRCFSLMDSKAGFFGIPFMYPSIGQAVRAVLDLASDPASMVSKHAGDFSLFQVGVWDDQTGRYTDQIPEFIVSCSAMLPNLTAEDYTRNRELNLKDAAE